MNFNGIKTDVDETSAQAKKFIGTCKECIDDIRNFVAQAKELDGLGVNVSALIPLCEEFERLAKSVEDGALAALAGMVAYCKQMQADSEDALDV